MHPVSIRFRRDAVYRSLKKEAGSRGLSTSALAERLIDEGLRSGRHPLITFRDGPAGRRAGLVGGPDVWEVVSALTGGDVPREKRVERVADLLGLRTAQVEAALAYYAEFTDEIDVEIAENDAAADEWEAAWRRQQELLGR
ncbi:MAG: hypothetical protein HYU28_03920 [Actinobacteria bacterium]|nr:hypothetical protein [Actinomycetota bacterium]